MTSIRTTIFKSSLVATIEKNREYLTARLQSVQETIDKIKAIIRRSEDQYVTPETAKYREKVLTSYKDSEIDIIKQLKQIPNFK